MRTVQWRHGNEQNYTSPCCRVARCKQIRRELLSADTGEKISYIAEIFSCAVLHKMCSSPVNLCSCKSKLRIKNVYFVPTAAWLPASNATLRVWQKEKECSPKNSHKDAPLLHWTEKRLKRYGPASFDRRIRHTQRGGRDFSAVRRRPGFQKQMCRIVRFGSVDGRTDGRAMMNWLLAASRHQVQRVARVDEDRCVERRPGLRDKRTRFCVLNCSAYSQLVTRSLHWSSENLGTVTVLADDIHAVS